MNRHYVKFFNTFVIVCLMFSLVACATLNEINPVGVAVTAEQKAFALYSTYVVWAERAPAVVRDKSIPIALRRRVQSTMKHVHPAVNNLYGVAKTVSKARFELSRGQITDETLRELTIRLNNAITSTEPMVKAMVKAMEAIQ